MTFDVDVDMAGRIFNDAHSMKGEKAAVFCIFVLRRMASLGDMSFVHLGLKDLFYLI